MFSNPLIKLAIAACCLFASNMQATEPNYLVYAQLLNNYSTAEGVDYARWSEQADHIVALNHFVAQLGQSDVQALPHCQQKALYINLYNAAMLQAVLQHYPIKSVKEIGLFPLGIFKQNFIRLGDKQLSLDSIEKGILLTHFSDLRIHFAVKCASESCPPLRSKPYTGSELDVQLEQQTRLFANSTRAARLDVSGQTIAYSQLFKWYQQDFQVHNPAEYLNLFRHKALPTAYKTDWINYDWSLNQAP